MVLIDFFRTEDHLYKINTKTGLTVKTFLNGQIITSNKPALFFGCIDLDKALNTLKDHGLIAGKNEDLMFNKNVYQIFGEYIVDLKARDFFLPGVRKSYYAVGLDCYVEEVLNVTEDGIVFTDDFLSQENITLSYIQSGKVIEIYKVLNQVKRKVQYDFS